MATKKVFVAGFGGQGVLLIGQMLAYAAMYEGKEATWMPSYGPEMRGGTANCTVCISDKPIASPLVTTCDVLVAMNGPSLRPSVCERFRYQLQGPPHRCARPLCGLHPHRRAGSGQRQDR